MEDRNTKMKRFTVCFKTTSVIDNTIEDHVEDIEDEEEREILGDQIARVMGKYIKFGEYVTLEFDLETDTARVVKL